MYIYQSIPTRQVEQRKFQSGCSWKVIIEKVHLVMLGRYLGNRVKINLY